MLKLGELLEAELKQKVWLTRYGEVKAHRTVEQHFKDGLHPLGNLERAGTEPNYSQDFTERGYFKLHCNGYKEPQRFKQP